MIGGEMISLIESVDFSSKSELLEKLRNMRKSTLRLSPTERAAVKQMIGIGLQQVYFTTEKELLRFKAFIDGKKKKIIHPRGANDVRENSSHCQASV